VRVACFVVALGLAVVEADMGRQAILELVGLRQCRGRDNCSGYDGTGDKGNMERAARNACAQESRQLWSVGQDVQDRPPETRPSPPPKEDQPLDLEELLGELG
jgi:hypothetical protein